MPTQSADELIHAYESFLHDMKTNLTVSFSRMQEMELIESMPQDARRILSELTTNWYRMVKLMQDMTDHTRFRQGNLMPKWKNMDIVSVIRDMADAAKPMADRKNIQLVVEAGVAEKRMAIDKHMLERVILNLLSNAFKFTGTGGLVRVVIQDLTEYISIRVIDNGPGISKEMREIVFERYVSQTGSGLGLTIVQELTQLLGGNVQLDTSVDTGTAMVLTLPVFLAQEADNALLVGNLIEEQIVQIELS